MPRFVPATEKVALDWLVTLPNEPPVLKSSIFEMLLVLATTEKARVACRAVLVSPSSVVNVALSELF